MEGTSVLRMWRAQRWSLVREQTLRNGPGSKDLQGPGDLLAGSYHKIVELWRPGHELWFALSHTDLHKSSVLAGLGLPHLTYYPVEKTGNRGKGLGMCCKLGEMKSEQIVHVLGKWTVDLSDCFPVQDPNCALSYSLFNKLWLYFFFSDGTQWSRWLAVVNHHTIT